MSLLDYIKLSKEQLGCTPTQLVHGTRGRKRHDTLNARDLMP